MKKMQLSAIDGITKDTKFNPKEEKYLVKKLSNIKYLIGMFQKQIAVFCKLYPRTGSVV